MGSEVVEGGEESTFIYDEGLEVDFPSVSSVVVSSAEYQLKLQQ